MPLARSRLAVVASLLLVGCQTPRSDTTDDGESETTAKTTTETAGTTEDCPVGSQGCACTGGAGCDLGLTCNLEKMLCEGGGGSTTGSESSSEPPTQTSTGSTDEEQTSSSGTGETIGPDCTSTGDGKVNDACMDIDPNRPFCVDDKCVGCDTQAEDACKLGTGNQRPLCLDTGACGQCDSNTALQDGQCTAESPHCNLDTNLCEGCFEHSECPQSACKIAERECFPADNILYVRQGSPGLKCCDAPGSGGSKDFPYCDFELATAAAQLNGFNADYTFIALGNEAALGKGQTAVNIAGGDGKVSYAFLHELGNAYEKHTQFVGIGPMISVPMNVTLYINNFGVVVENGQGDSSVGVSCSNGSVWLDDSRVTGARGPNIRSNECDIHLRRTSVAFGSTEGVDMVGGALHAVNSFISSNMSKPNLGGGGVHLHSGATLDALYTTIADNASEPNKGLGDSIHCDGPASIKLRNSIVVRRPVGANQSIICPEGDFNITFSTLDYDVDITKGHDTLKKAAEDMLMALDIDNSTGVFRVNAPTEFFKTAMWVTGDPHFDYESDLRKTDGTADYAGADAL